MTTRILQRLKMFLVGRPQLKTSLTTSTVGGTLFLKLCGYVEAEKAEVLDVSESRLRLRVGEPSWFWRLWNGTAPLEITLDIDAGDPHADASAARSSVNVLIRPLGMGTHAFEDRARRVLWRLRWHLMAV